MDTFIDKVPVVKEETYLYRMPNMLQLVKSSVVNVIFIYFLFLK